MTLPWYLWMARDSLWVVGIWGENSSVLIPLRDNSFHFWEASPPQMSPSHVMASGSLTSPFPAMNCGEVEWMGARRCSSRRPPEITCLCFHIGPRTEDKLLSYRNPPQQNRGRYSWSQRTAARQYSCFPKTPSNRILHGQRTAPSLPSQREPITFRGN